MGVGRRKSVVKRDEKTLDGRKQISVRGERPSLQLRGRAVNEDRDNLLPVVRCKLVGRVYHSKDDLAAPDNVLNLDLAEGRRVVLLVRILPRRPERLLWFFPNLLLQEPLHVQDVDERFLVPWHN